MRKAAWPGLEDKTLVDRARKMAKRNGVWSALSESYDPNRAIEVIKHSDYRSFKRSGESLDNRSWMMQGIQEAATTVWLDHPNASIDRLQDLLWAACETTTWVCSSHEYCGLLDLGSTTMAANYAEILYMLEHRMETEVVERVRKEIRRRVLDPGVDYRETPWWTTEPMNWNLVCNCNLITTALYELENPYLAHYLFIVINRLPYGLDAFAEDGGCYEGPGYWGYGFSHYLKSAIMLEHRTGGKLKIMKGDKIEGICRFPLAATIKPGRWLTICDCGHGYLGVDVACMINRFYDIPELFALTRRKTGGAAKRKGCIGWSWRNAAMEVPMKAKRMQFVPRDYLYPKLGLALVRSADMPARAALGVFASHNNCPHNHNDVGSFVYHTMDAEMITDPGSPRYNSWVFGPRRYEHPHTRTMGHSLPIVNGHEQKAGKRYRGFLRATGLNEKGAKTVTADIGKAYPDKTLRRLRREFTLEPDGELNLCDSFSFTRKPHSVEEGFATYESARVRRKGAEIVIGTGRKAVVLSSVETPGKFKVRKWGPEAETWTTDRRLWRITFSPDKLAQDMELRFKVNQH
ncbi:MAG: heparinase II/III family protein [Kiritimatiellia bacterium]